MIEHVYRRAAETRGVDAVVVATDDARIVGAVESFGGVARMTHAGHRTGTDRIAEIARDLPCAIVVNVQGDLPLVEPGIIAQVVESLVADASLPMSTVCCPVANDDEYRNPNVVKVVRDETGDAIYFSRAPIPFFRSVVKDSDAGPPDGGPYEDGKAFRRPAMKHIGLYGYRRDFLLEFATMPQTALERAESLEQLRALEHGFRIRVVETRSESVEVDTPEDLERVRRLIAADAPPRNAVKAFR
jgi:3-deoxy-manno-octulosonate cytidylyltransferase (CMP-KDO synthetase)